MSSALKRPAAISARQRLLNQARSRGENFQVLLTRYALERLLYRLAQGPYCERFVLKGAMLFVLWADLPHRATRDLDLLGYGSSDLKDLEAVFRDVCQFEVDVDDGLDFLPDTVSARLIRGEALYKGGRVIMKARLGQASIPIQVDVGFGDAVVPTPMWRDYPVLLGHPAPKILAYAKPTVIAEKLAALVRLGMINSRLKDYYDMYWLAQHSELDEAELVASILATFRREGLELPEGIPTGLTDHFATDPLKQKQWLAFLRKLNLTGPGGGLEEVVACLRCFLGPVLERARGIGGELGRWSPLEQTWG